MTTFLFATVKVNLLTILILCLVPVLLIWYFWKIFSDLENLHFLICTAYLQDGPKMIQLDTLHRTDPNHTIRIYKGSDLIETIRAE